MRTLAVNNDQQSETCLPAGRLLPQPEVAARLARRLAADGRVDRVLDALEDWLRGLGYFDHLRVPNEYLTFPPAPESGGAARLQINYARLAYKPPTPADSADAARPACPLCFENVGAPGKERLRVAEFELAGADYFAHPTPFPLFEGHFVVNSRRHEPMRIGEPGLREAAAFLAAAPGWLVASNSDVEWAGASVLGHHHLQVFRRLDLPVEQAVALHAATGDDGVALAYPRWYCPVARLVGPSEALLRRAVDLVARWKATAPGRATCNFLLRASAPVPASSPGRLALHLFFRHPDFRTPAAWTHIKSEGVGIIEMAGEVIVPPLADRDREANRAWFTEHGPDVVRAVIGGNAPRDARLTDAYYAHDLLGL